MESLKPRLLRIFSIVSRRGLPFPDSVLYTCDRFRFACRASFPSPPRAVATSLRARRRTVRSLSLAVILERDLQVGASAVRMAEEFEMVFFKWDRRFHQERSL